MESLESAKIKIDVSQANTVSNNLRFISDLNMVIDREPHY